MLGYEFKNLNKYVKIKHIVTNRLDGFSHPPFDSLNLGLHVDDEKVLVIKNREKVTNQLGYPIDDLVSMKLIHGSNVEIIQKTNKGKEEIRDTDAMITNIRGIILGVFVADCVPSIIYDPKNHAIAVIHGGWRGLAQNIGSKTIDKMIDTYDTAPENLIVGIGPAICGKCYEVGDEIKNKINKKFPSFAKEVLKNNKGKDYLNIQKLMKLQLKEKGVKSIEIANVCTLENKDYFSYRRDKKTGRFGIFAVLK